ncbi:MAG TPA: hypothetical protein VN675_01895, partial [Burkholderiales bacterium]|nr:hypothetical protein [Burkholderiales bacterium]
YIDVDYGRVGDAWVSLGSWGNHDPGTGAGQWVLHTLSIRNRKLEFAHTSPFHGEYIGPTPQPDVPLRRWVRFTAYLLYEGGNGFVQVWQDGVAMLRAEVPQLARDPGTRLHTAHWGMYASGDLDHGVLYNDEIAICALAAPLTDLATEPRCPRADAQNR